jgi:hypothetical protein
MLAEHEGPDTVALRTDEHAVGNCAHPVEHAHGTHAIDEPNAERESTRSIDESRAEHDTIPSPPPTEQSHTSPAPPEEPERRGASRYLRELAESVEALEGHRVDNPIGVAIGGSRDELSSTCGSALDVDRCAMLCPVSPDGSR